MINPLKIRQHPIDRKNHAVVSEIYENHLYHTPVYR